MVTFNFFCSTEFTVITLLNYSTTVLKYFIVLN